MIGEDVQEATAGHVVMTDPVPVPASIDAAIAGSYLDRKYPATPGA
jgi:hypothetical protein